MSFLHILVIVPDFPNLSKGPIAIVAFCSDGCYAHLKKSVGDLVENKFEKLRFWIKDILICIKKDIKTDYLPGDRILYRKYFGNRPLNRLNSEEIFSALEKELLEGNESLTEWVVNHWVFQNGDLYNHFAEKLSEISPDFDELKELTIEDSQKVLEGVEAFDPIAIYLFSKLNAVVFPVSIFEKLENAALETKKQKDAESASSELKEGLEQIIERQQREISRLQEKYETRVAGVLRKYELDTEALKKQIRSLQKKLSV